ncbi:MAG: FkbM family methyltransferase [Bacteroidota bacterium]
MQKLKILFILHFPPPIHGAAMVGQYIRESEIINNALNGRYINLGTSRTIEEIGKGGFKKWVRYFGLIWKTVFNVVSFRPNLVYLTLTSKGGGFYKDALIAIKAKALGAKLVYHFHNTLLFWKVKWTIQETHRNYSFLFLIRKINFKKMRKKIVVFGINILYLLRLKLGIKIKGLGKLQQFLMRDFSFVAFEKIFYYNHQIEGSYDLLLIGKSNEPETQRFLDRLLPKLSECNFIDVGASIGEFLFYVSRYSNVEKIIGFEPRRECVKAIKMSQKLNGEERIQVFQNLVADADGSMEISYNQGGSSTGIYSLKENEVNKEFVDVVKLDNVLPAIMNNTIILVDVEGAEPLVLRSGMEFILKNKPLIIFEYNCTSKKHFSLEDINIILEGKYEFYRLKANGALDKDFTNSWNVVAIPENTIFQQILSS